MKVVSSKWSGVSKSAFFFGLYAVLVALCPFAQAQKPEKKVYRIAVLQRSTLPASFAEAFMRGLREHGYVEGHNIVIERRGTDGITGYSAAEVVRLGIDVIVATGTGAVLDAKKATQTIPIVMAPSADAVVGGLIDSLARPGGNITGLTMISPDLTGKRLELIKDAVPGVARVAAVYPVGTASTAIPPWLKVTETVANALGLKFQKLGLEPDANTWEESFTQAAKESRIALVVIENARLIAQRKRIGKLAARRRLPTMFSIKEHVEAGGLLSYGPDLVDVHYRAATYVDRILKGRKPADLPVEQPMKFEFIINLKTAKQIGLTIPPNVLARADRVIR